MTLKLMIPGPISVADDVLEAVGAPVCPNYGPGWISIHHELKDMLRQVMGTTGRVFVTAGSGHVGAELIFQSVLRRGERVLVGNNGFFGERWIEVLKMIGCEPVVVEAPLDQRLDPAAIGRAFAADPSIRTGLFVQLETGSAILNPIEEIAAICRAQGRLCIVDAVSSLAGTPLPMDAWGVDAVISASQKCLGGVPGLAVVAVNERVWEIARAMPPSEVRSWYLHLTTWQKYEDESPNWHPYPATMPSPAMLGLHAALVALVAEGLDARLARYRQRAAHLRARLTDLGLPLFVPAEWMSPVLTTAVAPVGIRPVDVMLAILQAENIMIGVGLPPLGDRVLRFGHMGVGIDDADIERMLARLAVTLRNSL